MAFHRFFEVTIRGWFREVSLPAFGKQDVGISPGGAMDGFALDCGNALLGNPADSPALEMLIPPLLTARMPLWFALTGPSLPKAEMETKVGKIPLQTETVYWADEGSRLRLGPRKSGLRSYLCFRDDYPGNSRVQMAGRTLKGVKGLLDWIDHTGLIRVIDGPEVSLLHNPNTFFSTPWTVDAKTDEMGMRLTSPLMLSADRATMISEAVSTGTVQLTPHGPIVLLKHRQTVGGYPRVFSVISADVDLLAQRSPGDKISFRRVTIEDAWRAARQKAEAVTSLRRRFSL